MFPDKDIEIEYHFPQLSTTGYKITSPKTPKYNCIAWAGNDSDRFWWPTDEYGYYWPDTIEKRETVEVFIEAYKTIGFNVCDNSDYEGGWEKIAIYADHNNLPKHAARMIDERTWTSKLGRNYDISHTINGLDGNTYGSPKIFMKRKIAD